MPLPTDDSVASRMAVSVPVTVADAPRRRLPSAAVTWTTRATPVGPPLDEYRSILGRLDGLRRPGYARADLEHLAAILTLAKFLERALSEFFQARNRANAALAAMRALMNTKLPWPEEERRKVAAAVAALADDPVLGRTRSAAEVAVGRPSEESSLREGIESFLAFLDAPGPNGWAELRRWAEELEDLAARSVGESSSVFVDIDGVGRFDLGGGVPERADIVAWWTAWAVKAYVTQVRGRGWGAARDAAAFVDVVLPREEPLSISGATYKLWRRFFPLPRGLRVEDSRFAASPAALWLADAGGIAGRFKELARRVGSDPVPPPPP